MSYVLESEQQPGKYLLFRHGSSPTVVDLNRAQKFSDVSKAFNRTLTIPKTLNQLGPWKVVSVEDKVGVIEKNEQFIDVKNYQKKIDESILPIKEVLGNKEFLEHQLKELELILQDIDHYIEFKKLNITSGYWVYKVRKTIRERRRDIKENLYYIDYLQTASLPQIISGKNKPVPENQRYKPRTDIGKEFFSQKHISKDFAERICKELGGIVE